MLKYVCIQLHVFACLKGGFIKLAFITKNELHLAERNEIENDEGIIYVE